MTSNPHRLPRAVHPVRYDLVLEPDLDRASFTGSVDIALVVDEATDELVCNAAELTLTSAVGRRRRVRDRRRVDDRRGARAGHVRAALGAARRDGGPPLAGLHRHAERQAPRLVPLDLQGRGGQRAGHRHQPDAGHGLPPGLPLLGRARLQGRVRGDDGRRRRPAGHLQRAGGVARGPAGRPPRRPLRRHDVHVDLPGGLHRRPAGGHRPGRRRRRPDAPGPRAGQGGAGRLRAGGRAVRPPLVPGLLRDPLPVGQGRPRRAARLRGRGHGEPGLHHVPGERPARRPRDGHADRGAARGRRRVARARAHVVRRPRDHALVERDLAERGLRDLHGGRGLRRVPAGLEAVGDLQPRADRGLRDRQPDDHPARGVRGRVAGGRRRDVRRPDLREGRRARSACWSSTWARSGSGTASATTWPSTATGTPRRPTCGTRSRPPPASPSGASWTAGSGRRAIPSSPPRSTPTARRSCSASTASSSTRRAPTRRPSATPAGPSRSACARSSPAAPTPARRRSWARRRSRRCCSTRTSCGSPCVSPDAVVVVNSGGHGFYRVAYDDALRTRLAAAAQRELSTVERYALVDDTWAAVVAGSVEATAFCQLADRLRRRARRRRLADARGRPRLVRPPARRASRGSGSAPSCGSWSGPRLQALGWQAAEGEDDLTGELRGLLIRALAVLGDDADAQATASELFEQQLRDPAAVDPPVTAAVVERRRGDRRRGRVRPLRRALQGGDDTPGAAPVPVRAGRLPGRGPDGPNPGVPARSGRQVAERAVRAGSLHPQPRTGRAGLAVRPRALGPRQRRVPEPVDRPDDRPGQDPDPSPSRRPTSPASSPSTTSRRPPRPSSRCWSGNGSTWRCAAREAPRLAAHFTR